MMTPTTPAHWPEDLPAQRVSPVVAPQFSMRILVIEDDPDTRENLCDILELDGYQVDTAACFGEVMARRDLSEFGAVIVDRQLPDGTADEYLPRLKREAADASIIVITGYADLDGAIAALRAGAADYTLKPVNADALRARLAALAETRRLSFEKQRAESAFRALVEAAPCLIVICRHDGTVLYVNFCAVQTTGYVTDEIRDYLPVDRLIADQSSQPPNPGPLRKFLSGNTTGRSFENQLICKDGLRRWIVWQTQALDDYQGMPAVMGVGQDLTERKLAEESLRKEKAFAESLVETAPAIVLVLDPEAKIVRYNAYMEELSGWRLSEMQGKDWIETFVPQPWQVRFEAVFRQTLSESYTGGIVNPILMRSGRQRQIKWANKTLNDAEGNPALVLCIGHDVTDLQEAQQKALQAERLAAIGQMMAGLSHESRNALQRSKACLEMLELEVATNADASELVRRLTKAQEHLQRLYEEVRSYAAPIQLSRELCDLRQLWRETWSHIAPLHPNKEIALREEVAIDDCCCLADRFAVGQVFGNILENAVAVIPDPGVIVVSCKGVKLAGRPALEIAFLDNGPGLDAEQQERIFEPFFTSKTKGTGLGMAIAKRIIESHGGEISVRNRTPPGAEIVTVIPRGFDE